MEILMEIREVQMEMSDNPGRFQIIVLGEVGGARAFPILVGYYEALQLDLALHGQTAPRPLTHDLVLNAIHTLGAEIERIVIDDLRDDTFFGKLVVRQSNGEESRIDSRPSDAIVIATKTGVPIFVEDHVLARTCRETEGGEPPA